MKSNYYANKVPNLSAMANMRGYGAAHEYLCRRGHPTDVPRFPGEIEYKVSLRGPFGELITIERMAESLRDAIQSAKIVAVLAGLIDLPEGFDEDDIKVDFVRAFDIST